MKQVIPFKLNYITRLTTTIIALMTVATAFAQDDATISEMMRKQFYGNRIKGATVLLGGSFQYRGFQSNNQTGDVLNFGLGMGIGLSEKFAVNIGYNHSKTHQNLYDGTGSYSGFVKEEIFQAGFRFLPKTVGGFVQFYTGFDYFSATTEFTNRSGNFNTGPDAVIGLNFPVGVIFWISTFMSVSVEPVNLTLSKLDNEMEDTGQLDFGLSTFSPSFGINFLINSKKPEPQ